MVTELLRERPITPLLDSIESPDDLRPLRVDQLSQLSGELRNYILYTVGQTGGHFGAGLGVVELTLALHYLLNTPEDYLIWDVGHQSYPHKILTGRRDQMLSIRSQGGLAPFPEREESPYDCFGTGHSSTSISAALGFALANRLNGSDKKTVAVIGDGALTGGMAFEALNHAAHTGANLLVILNDNSMSISPNEGGLATYLAKQVQGHFGNHPAMTLFEALNCTYHGPIDGHDFAQLLPAIEQGLDAVGPQFLHVVTQKGKGYGPAEADPVAFHAIAKVENVQPKKQPTFSNQFGRWICERAQRDSDLVAITPAMREGSDLVEFSERFPDRYFDVAIAEQHAATLATGLALGGKKPVLAIYSTFLQRALDQVIHDLALQRANVLLAIDRAGLVGQDGDTHVGAFDIAMLSPLPDAVIMAPATYSDLHAMLDIGFDKPGLTAVRYPRGGGIQTFRNAYPVEFGKAWKARSGQGIAILNFGVLMDRALEVGEELNLSVYDMRFVKPLDESALEEAASSHDLLVTLEDHALQGGAGALVNLWLAERTNKNPRVSNLGLINPWCGHGSRNEQLKLQGLDPLGLKETLTQLLKTDEFSP